MPGERDAARPWLNIRRMPHAPDFSESLPPVLLHDLPARAAALLKAETTYARYAALELNW